LICPKVRLADIIKPTEKQNYQTALNKISRKHIDFVLCDPATAKIFGVIELDDKSHERADRVTRDAFVDSVFAAAGIQIIHFKASASYSVEEIRQQLKSILEH
jgi:very-short-patch-repair endonuclease